MSKVCCNETVCCSGEGKKANGQEQEASIKTQIFILLISLISLIVSFIEPESWAFVLHYINPAWVAVILCGYPIFQGAYTALVREKKVSSSLLITVAIFASVALEIIMLATGDLSGDGHGESYIFAAGEIAFLMALGEMIEDYTVRRSRAGIERLAKLIPTTARIKRGGEILEVLTSEVLIDDIVVVKPNDMIPVDGIVTAGVTAVDQSAMTGESVPVDKAAGDSVFGGTWNKSGAIEVRVTKKAEDMAISKLVNLVEEAEGRKAPISRIADKWASMIVPAAILLSVLVSAVAYFILGTPPLGSIIRGVTILVVFCPCALALATPTAIAAGLGNAAKRGVLVKSGEAIEILARVKAMTFDKTGTLTKGIISVDEIKSYHMDEQEMLTLAAAAEQYSEHPIAGAVTRYAKSRLDSIPDAQSTESLMGLGVKARVLGKEITVCKWEHAQKLDIDISDAKEDAQRFLTEGGTVVAVCADDVLAGILSLSDMIREDAKDAVAEIKKLGIDVLMLTGDNAFSAGHVAKAVGISNIEHSLMPDDKLARIEKIKSEGKPVCMIGDGVNDAPALALADCSIAMGDRGSDIAMETADITLIGNNIKRIPGLFALSKRVISTIKINITISMTINILAVILSTFGVLNPVTGALIHNLASILVVLNSAFLLSVKDRQAD